MESNCKKLNKAQIIGLRAIFPVWKATPTAVIQKEAAASLIHHMLDYLRELAALRLHKPEVQNPLSNQTKRAHTTANPSRLERIVQKCPNRVE